MKNLFKFGFFTFALSLSLTSCHFFSNDPKTVALDSNKIDSAKLSQVKIDSVTPDSSRIKSYSIQLKP